MAEAKRPLGKGVAILMAIWVLLGVLPVLAQMFGASFLASTEWTSRASSLGIISGLGTALLVTWLVWGTEDDETDSYVKWFARRAGAAVFAYAIGSYAVVIAGPMMIALLAGHPVSLPFTVSNTDRVGSKWCRQYVEFQELPLLFDRVCGVPSEIRDNLPRGTRIVVFGHGTDLGIYAKRLRRAD